MPSDESSPTGPNTSLAGSKFYQGKIRALFRGRQSGIVTSARGRELLFHFPFVRMVGSRRRFEDLREGMSVGFDVGWTSRGVRITVLRLPDEDTE